MSEAGTWLRFVLAALAVWRLTHLLAAEDGPWDLILRARGRLGATIWGKMLDCFNCLSLWIAIPFACFVVSGGGMRLSPGSPCRVPPACPIAWATSCVRISRSMKEQIMGCCGQGRAALVLDRASGGKPAARGPSMRIEFTQPRRSSSAVRRPAGTTSFMRARRPKMWMRGTRPP